MRSFHPISIRMRSFHPISECIYNNMVHAEGSTIPHIDGCNQCRCEQGVVANCGSMECRKLEFIHVSHLCLFIIKLNFLRLWLYFLNADLFNF